MSPRRKRAARVHSAARKAHAFATHDVTKFLVVAMGFFGEHRLATQARATSDSQNLVVAGAVAAQVAEERDSIASLKKRLESLEKRERLSFLKARRYENQFPIGPPEPPKRTGLLALIFGR